LGTGTTKAQGDANGDNVVNAADLTVWKNQYGFTATSAGAAGAVPEPTAAILLIAATSAIVWRRRTTGS
jgi:hypothetical protein